MRCRSRLIQKYVNNAYNNSNSLINIINDDFNFAMKIACEIHNHYVANTFLIIYVI